MRGGELHAEQIALLVAGGQLLHRHGHALTIDIEGLVDDHRHRAAVELLVVQRTGQHGVFVGVPLQREIAIPRHQRLGARVAGGGDAAQGIAHAVELGIHLPQVEGAAVAFSGQIRARHRSIGAHAQQQVRAQFEGGVEAGQPFGVAGFEHLRGEIAGRLQGHGAVGIVDHIQAAAQADRAHFGPHATHADVAGHRQAEPFGAVIAHQVQRAGFLGDIVVGRVAQVRAQSGVVRAGEGFEQATAVEAGPLVDGVATGIGQEIVLREGLAAGQVGSPDRSDIGGGHIHGVGVIGVGRFGAAQAALDRGEEAAFRGERGIEAAGTDGVLAMLLATTHQRRIGEVVRVVHIERRIQGDARHIAAVVIGVIDVAGVLDAADRPAVDVGTAGAQAGAAFDLIALGVGVGQIGGQRPRRARPEDHVEPAAGVFLLAFQEIAGGIDRGAAGVVQQRAIVGDHAVVEVAHHRGQRQIRAVFGVITLGVLVIQVHFHRIAGPPLQRGELRIALVVLDELAVDAAAGHQVIRHAVGDLVAVDLGAVARRADHFTAIAGHPGGAAGEHLFRVAAFQRLHTDGDTELAGVAHVELVDVAGGTAPADAVLVLEAVIVVLPGAPAIELEGALAVLQWFDRLHVDRAGHATFDEVGALGLVDRHGVDQLGRELVEVHRAVATAIGGLAAIEGGRTEERAQATDRDLRRTALLAMGGGAGDGFDRFTDRERRQITDVVSGQHIGDHGLLALLVDRGLDGAADAGHLDLIQRGGLPRRRGRCVGILCVGQRQGRGGAQGIEQRAVQRGAAEASW